MRRPLMHDSTVTHRRHVAALNVALTLFWRSTRVIPRIVPSAKDNMSFSSRFADTLSGIFQATLAATLENIQIVPKNTGGAVLADGRQRACRSVKRMRLRSTDGHFTHGWAFCRCRAVGSAYRKEIVIMIATLPFTTQTLRRSVIGAFSVLAIVPLLYFAACSSGDDDGGGSPPPGGGGGSTAVQNAYVVAGASEIQAYKMDNDGNLTAVGTPIATGGNPHHVNVDPSGRFVYVSNHDSPFLSGWRANADASLVPMNAALTGSPVTGTDPTENESHWSVLDQTGRFLYVVAGTGASTLRAYNVDQTPGNTLGIPTFISGQSFAVGTHAHNVIITPNNQFLYVAAENAAGEVHAFSRDTSTGALTPVGTITGLNNPAALAADPSNRFLYVGYLNSIEVLSIGANGALTRITPVSAFETNLRGTGSGPHSIAMHPNGQTLYCANINSNTLTVFQVDQGTGALTEIQTQNPATGFEPNHVVIHPNGRFLYTADTSSDQLSRFTINADGTLVTPATVIPAGNGANNMGFTRF